MKTPLDEQWDRGYAAGVKAEQQRGMAIVENYCRSNYCRSAFYAKAEQCEHEQYDYEDCDQCLIDYLLKTIGRA